VQDLRKKNRGQNSRNRLQQFPQENNMKARTQHKRTEQIKSTQKRKKREVSESRKNKAMLSKENEKKAGDRLVLLVG
jgi:hypothetical protein